MDKFSKEIKENQFKKAKEESYCYLITSLTYYIYKFEPSREEREEIINLIKNW